MVAHSAQYPAVILSVNRALWGEVSSSLRSVQVEYGRHEIEIFRYFDGEVSEEDMESMSRVASEVAADFPEHKIYEHSIRVDYPTSINPTEESRHIVFMRKEA
jgi:hypothetical protein